MFGIELICRVLSEHGCPIAPSTCYGASRHPPSARARRDEQLKAAIARVHQANYDDYGARKVWLAPNREGTAVARSTGKRLMRELGRTGARRGKPKRTTAADPATACPADLVKRRLSPPAPDRLWVADFTYVLTWAGMVYVAFVIDAYSRQILGWRAATSMRTGLVLDALEQALWARRREGQGSLAGLAHHTDAGSQATRWCTAPGEGRVRDQACPILPAGEAVTGADVVVLAVPGGAVAEVVALAGKVVIDAANRIGQPEVNSRAAVAHCRR